jgi:hypothetical protein
MRDSRERFPSDLHSHRPQALFRELLFAACVWLGAVVPLAVGLTDLQHPFRFP